jgi:hypothetical protein
MKQGSEEWNIVPWQSWESQCKWDGEIRQAVLAGFPTKFKIPTCHGQHFATALASNKNKSVLNTTYFVKKILPMHNKQTVIIMKYIFFQTYLHNLLIVAENASYNSRKSQGKKVCKDVIRCMKFHTKRMCLKKV